MMGQRWEFLSARSTSYCLLQALLWMLGLFAFCFFKLINILGLKFLQKVTRTMLAPHCGLLKGNYLRQVGQGGRWSWLTPELLFLCMLPLLVERDGGFDAGLPGLCYLVYIHKALWCYKMLLHWDHRVLMKVEVKQVIWHRSLLLELYQKCSAFDGVNKALNIPHETLSVVFE